MLRARELAERAYGQAGHDPVRSAFEETLLARLLPRLLDAAPGRWLLDLGCGDGLAARLAGGGRYLGVDLRPTATDVPAVAHDLREGIGPVGARPFDLYLGSFGVASHLSPDQLRRLLRDIAGHARPGSLVALEALGLHSLEWPRLWGTPPGEARTIPYRLGADVTVHPWGPFELGRLFEEVGIRLLATLDRTLQAGPKLGEERYWPALPPVRQALNDLLDGGEAAPALGAPLPPLPAGRAALVHHTLQARRQRLLGTSAECGPQLARAIWRLEPPSSGGFGHGLLAVGRVT